MRNSRYTLRRILKFVYRIFPLPTGLKLRMKEKALSKFGMISSLSVSRPIRHTDEQREIALAHFCSPRRKAVLLREFEEPGTAPGEIAVHIHLYYIDMAEDFLNYLSHIPYSFDLFVSITDADNQQYVARLFPKCPNVRRLKVVVVFNRGRDVAPMITAFPELPTYGYFLHIHTKKSPHLEHTFNWREHLLKNLTGSREHIMRVFRLFESYPDIGIVYPEPNPELPYWTLTTLSNESEMRRLFELIGIEFPDKEKYVDFPVGTMFWARGTALQKLFTPRISLEVFQEECGQLDGTLSHAVERSLCLIISDAGYLPAQLDIDKGFVHIGPGARNLAEYLATEAAEMERYLRSFKHIVFDVFGTLVCSDYEKYDQLADDAFWESGRKRAVEPEFEIFAESCRPRSVVADIFMRLQDDGYDVVIAEDTVWTLPQMEKILEMCKITGFRDIYLSGSIGMRKRDGSMYSFLAENRFKNRAFVHVGNHELDDMQTPNDLGISTFHVMHPHDMMTIGSFDEKYYDRCRDDPFCLRELFGECAERTDVTEFRA